MQTIQYIWLALVLLFVIIEASTAALVSIWFCVGALAALVVSFIAPANVVAQIIVFLLVSAATIVALRPLSKRLLSSKRVVTNVDANIGKRCKVIEEIRPDEFGRVMLEGVPWTAKADVPLAKDSWCVVTAIEGVKLVVAPAPPVSH